MCSALSEIEDDETVQGVKASLLEGAKALFLAKKDVLLAQREIRQPRRKGRS